MEHKEQQEDNREDQWEHNREVQEQEEDNREKDLHLHHTMGPPPAVTSWQDNVEDFVNEWQLKKKFLLVYFARNHLLKIENSQQEKNLQCILKCINFLVEGEMVLPHSTKAIGEYSLFH